jgi:altronate dehydratase
MKRKAIVLNIKDNVASALMDLKAVEQAKVEIPGGEIKDITLIQAIQLGHKFALRDIAQGEDVLKSGMSIGCSTKAIGPGEHVHTHNVSNEHDDTIVQQIIN